MGEPGLQVVESSFDLAVEAVMAGREDVSPEEVTADVVRNVLEEVCYGVRLSVRQMPIDRNGNVRFLLALRDCGDLESVALRREVGMQVSSLLPCVNDFSLRGSGMADLVVNVGEQKDEGRDGSIESIAEGMLRLR